MKRGRRRGKYADETVAFCMACVDAAKSNAEVRSSTKTKVTLKAVYAYHHRRLADRGVGDFAEFSRIVHAYRARESRDRVKRLESQKTAAEPSTKRGKNGIIRP